MSEFLQRFEKAVSGRRLWPARARILVAVSGGVDSMVLLHGLKALAVRHGWKLIVAHFNHQLRGRASDADERLVREMAKALKVPVTVGRGDVKAFARTRKISIEMAARQARHEFLARTARLKKAGTIALAHHADDQVELFFLRWLRGAGGEGLGGMKRRGPSFVDKKVMLVRPLLDFSKAELMAFAQEQKIRFRQDASNAANDFLRNRIRNELLPLLREKYQPAVDRTVLRLMEITGAEAELVGHIADHWGRHIDTWGGDFATLPVAIQRRVLQTQLATKGVKVDFELVERLREAADTFVSVNPVLAVARAKGGRLKFKQTVKTAFSEGEQAVELRGRAGRIVFVGQTMQWKLQKQGKFVLPPKQNGREYFDGDKVGKQIVLRHWRAGDRFQPIGLAAATKLQDLFVNAKIPATRRRELILATTAAGIIFWVEGLRIGEEFKLTALTRQRLVWDVKKV